MAMLEGPLPLVTVKAKVCDEPEPEAGRVETTAGGPEAGTVQVPVVVQGLYTELLSWSMAKVFLAPLKALKLRGKLSVSVVPLVETEALAAVSVHCALEREVAVPGVMGPRKVVPASFIRYKALAPWL